MDESDNLHLSGADDSPCKSNENAPHLRRSQRASAKRAHDLIKGEAKQEMIFSCKKEENVVKPRKASILENGEPESPDNMEKSTPRKLVDPSTIDASDAHFAVQMTESGTIVVLSEESDISSLHTKEIDFLRKNFEKLKYKELTEEQLIERDRMIQELKTHLRIEEARLSLIKRVRQIQKLAHKDINQGHGSQATANLVARNNCLSNSNLPRPPAYKPPVATLPQQQSARNINSKQLPGSLNHGIRSNSGAAQAVVNAAVMNMHKHSTSMSGQQSATANAASTLHQKNSFLNDAAQQRQSQLTDGQTLAQREAAAKLAWRRQMEKTLLQIPPPKPPPAELHFVPNPNQPDFLYLVGLDEIVERILAAKENHLLKSQQKLAAAAEKASIAEKTPAKNDQAQPPSTATVTTASQSKKIVSARKRMLEGVENEPYSCAQCSTDYTPTWKKVDKDGRIMCEQCVRSNQKKALRIAHTNLLREKFGEALKQEREIERQIKDGTFNFASLAGNDSSPLPIRNTTSATSTLTSRGSAVNVLSASSAANVLTKQPPMIHQPPRHSASTNHLGHSTSSSSKQQSLSSTNAATAAVLSAAAASNPSVAFNNFGNMSSMMAAAQMLGVNWNPLLTQAAAAAAAAGRFPRTGNAGATSSNPIALRQNWQAALAAAAATSSSQSTSSSTAAATKEILKNMQQMQQQQQQQALQRQIYLDMMPRTQKWK